MFWLILGVLLWSGAHFFKRLAPTARANFAQSVGKQTSWNIIAVVVLIAIVLMVIGYRAADYIPVYEPPAFLRHVNNLMMVFALYLTSPGPPKGAILYRMRHPMLAGIKVWALAHLLANGDVASLILFGGMLGWAVVQMILINRSEPNWSPPEKGGLAKDGMFFGASIVLLIIIGLIHGLIGPSPFPG